MSGSVWAGAAVAAVTAGYALFSRRLATTVVSAPMVFTGCGIAIGPIGLGLLDLKHDAGPVLTLVEVALTLVLFTDAMSVRPRDLRLGGFLPGRLLGIGLPLTIGAGWLLAWPLLPGLTLWELALLGAVLAPTDAALGKTAVSDRRVPPLVRGGLNVESGLNDGMALPFFVLFLAALPGTMTSEEGAAGVFWRALVLSTAWGLAVGGIGGWLLRWSRARGWITGDWRQAFVLAVAAGAYAPAVAFEGSGFIAAWVAGFAFGASLRRSGPAKAPAEASAKAPAQAPAASDDTAGLAEHLADLLASLSFLVFGAVLLGPTLDDLDWRIIVYAVLSLTVVRMLPVALSLARTGLALPTVAYIGWFGPRGLASVVFGLLLVEEHVPGVQLLGRVIAVTVALSILLHGMSAVVLAKRYGAWYRKAADRRPRLREDLPGDGEAGHSPTAR
ncbi:sodium:proton antiporter [Streptomyces violarus]|uniref:NhaP-type Na+/H+ or K+/H+ antiporter n=1 Tax=Streptomyces violarus TaxID=67380 RepID=A0A7W4ZQ85_9ACTN|nr:MULTISPECIES: cation:proton antiporter [Streptomyces]MBB3076615.1 NhaP-type Na+/H+ or K+/H+ antiporter [Streptomyces violarus]WRT99405.1 cation:proton antiporter [Streptomyces sp. CGMCC 4.1772]GHD32193.1 sodium:proton antiporter [Streptomyces violarus]